MDSTSLPLPKDLRWRRLISVGIFLGLLYVFRALAPVLICFVIFERAFGWAADQISGRLRVKRKEAIAALLTFLIAALVMVGFLAVRRVIPLVASLRTDGRQQVEAILESSVVATVRKVVDIDVHTLTDGAKGYAMTAIGYLSATAYFALFVFVGFVLAVIYLFQREEIEEWEGGVPAGSVLGTLSRWLSYVADSIAITVRLQLIVALVNAVVTLPLLIVLGLPHVGMLFLLVLVAGLIPVVGGFLSGVVLCLVAYDAKGLWAVFVFLAVAFVLGKIESYYLSPRLTAEHVKLPSFVLVLSLLFFETAFGFYGLFLSFPALYVASRIANEWREQDAAAQAASVRPPSPAPSSGSTPG